MNWLIVLTGGVALITALLLIFSNIPYRPPAGPENGPIRPRFDQDRLLPVQHFDPVHRQELLPQYKIMSERFKAGDLKGALEIGQQMKKIIDSAVVELNIARVTLAVIDRDRNQMSPKELKRLQKSARKTLKKADNLIAKGNKGKIRRYPSNIKDYLKNIKNELYR